jgi:hypothetical protein
MKNTIPNFIDLKNLDYARCLKSIGIADPPPTAVPSLRGQRPRHVGATRVRSEKADPRLLGARSGRDSFSGESQTPGR